MRKIFTSLIAAVLTFISCTTIAGCSNPSTNAGSSNSSTNILKLDKTYIEIVAGEYTTFTATEGFEEYTWSVADNKFASVYPEGNTCKIYAYSYDIETILTVKAGSQSANCKLNIKTKNVSRVAGLLSYCSANTDSTLGVQFGEGAVSTYLNYATATNPIISIFPENGTTTEGGEIMSIKVSAPVLTTSDNTSLVEWILDNSTVTVTYYYTGPQAGLVGLNTFTVKNLTYSIANEKVTISNGVTSNIAHFNTLSANERNAILNNTITGLSTGFTDLISGIKKLCYYNITY